jgi:hypothetical protein
MVLRICPGYALACLSHIVSGNVRVFRYTGIYTQLCAYSPFFHPPKIPAVYTIARLPVIPGFCAVMDYYPIDK